MSNRCFSPIAAAAAVLAGVIFSSAPAWADPQIILGPLTRTAGSSFGSSVACLGGPFPLETFTSDFVASAPADDATPGFIEVIQGTGGAVFYTATRGQISQDFGIGLSAVGDVVGDSRPEFVYGDPQAAEGFGHAHVVSPGSSGIVNTILFGSGVASGGSRFSAASAGLFHDLSLDGLNDIVIGAPRHTGTDELSGQISFWGGNGSFFGSCPGQAGEQIGASLAPAGDILGEGLTEGPGGRPELLVGAPDSNSVMIYTGEGIFEGLCNDRIKITGPVDSFGAALSNVGDVNGDSFSDFLVGAPAALPSETGSQGQAFLYSGKDRTVLCTFTGEAEARLGSAVQGIGDFDGSGSRNFIISAPGENSGTGKVHIYEYSQSSGACVKVYTVDAPTNLYNFGKSVSSSVVGQLQCDMDGNERDDFVVGAQSDINGFRSGAVVAYANAGPSPTLTPTPSPTGTPTGTPTSSPTPFEEVPIGTPTPTATPTASPSRPPTASPTETPSPEPTKAPPIPSPTAIIQVAPTPKPITPKFVFPKSSRLGFGISLDGNLNGIVTYDMNPGGACSTKLLSRYSDANLQNVGPVRTLVTAKTTKRVTRFAAYGLKKAEIDSSCNKPYILHLIAKTSCLGTKRVLTSNVASRYLTCGQEPTLSLRSWEADFMKKIR